MFSALLFTFTVTTCKKKFHKYASPVFLVSLPVIIGGVPVSGTMPKFIPIFLNFFMSEKVFPPVSRVLD